MSFSSLNHVGSNYITLECQTETSPLHSATTSIVPKLPVRKGVILISNFRTPDTLSALEIADVKRSIEEIKQGKAREFDKVDDAIEWLNK